jgi:hypothetical protein
MSSVSRISDGSGGRRLACWIVAVKYRTMGTVHDINRQRLSPENCRELGLENVRVRICRFCCPDHDFWQSRRQRAQFELGDFHPNGRHPRRERGTRLGSR